MPCRVFKVSKGRLCPLFQPACRRCGTTPSRSSGLQTQQTTRFRLKLFAVVAIVGQSRWKARLEVLQTEAALNPSRNREKMVCPTAFEHFDFGCLSMLRAKQIHKVEIMFEKYGFGGVNVSVQAFNQSHFLCATTELQTAQLCNHSIVLRPSWHWTLEDCSPALWWSSSVTCGARKKQRNGRFQLQTLQTFVTKVDSGDGVTHLVPVTEGYLEPALVQRVSWLTAPLTLFVFFSFCFYTIFMIHNYMIFENWSELFSAFRQRDIYVNAQHNQKETEAYWYHIHPDTLCSVNKSF